MAHRREDPSKRYPYPFGNLLPDYDGALDELVRSRRDDDRHIPTFARRMLVRLATVGLRHRADVEPPANIRRAKLDKGQEVWLLFDTRRDREGYFGVEVVDTPRSDVAILAAMVAWLARKVDPKALRAADSFVHSGAYADQYKQIDALMKKALEEGQGIASPSAQSALDLLPELDDKIDALRHLEYIEPLIRYYKPDFDSRPPQEQRDLVEKACTHINGFLEALRKLQNFLEYGTPNQKKLTPDIEKPRQDVQAAVWSEVDGLTHRQIGERMGIPIPDVSKEKGGHETARASVERGKQTLKEAFGEKGWEKQKEEMKAQKARWQSLSQEKRDKIIREETRAL
jgi:hypothetical protein